MYITTGWTPVYWRLNPEKLMKHTKTTRDFFASLFFERSCGVEWLSKDFVSCFWHWNEQCLSIPDTHQDHRRSIERAELLSLQQVSLDVNVWKLNKLLRPDGFSCTHTSFEVRTVINRFDDLCIRYVLREHCRKISSTQAMCRRLRLCKSLW